MLTCGADRRVWVLPRIGSRMHLSQRDSANARVNPSVPPVYLGVMAIACRLLQFLPDLEDGRALGNAPDHAQRA